METPRLKQLREYQPFLHQLLQLTVAHHEFSSTPDLPQVYSETQKVVTILNHSTPLSWLPAVSLLVEKVCVQGGGARVPVSVMDRFFFNTPMLKTLAEYLTQFNALPSFDSILSRKDTGITDVAIFPEGSNCFFGRGERIQPFRSPRFIELALKMNAKIFLVVHRGSEDWALPLNFSEVFLPFQALLPGWFNEKVKRGGYFMIPTLPKKISVFRMMGEIYQPSLTLDTLSDNRATRKAQLWAETEIVRSRMQGMFDSLA